MNVLVRLRRSLVWPRRAVSVDRVVVRSLDDAPLDLRDAVVVICGPSPAGNRRARRLVLQAADAGRRVVWIDGCGEHQLDGNVVDAGSVEWLLAAEQLDAGLRAGIVWRLSDRVTGWRELRWVQRWAGLRGSLMALAANLRRVARLRRGVVLWRCVAAQLDAGLAPPAAIVHADDVAVTTAWHLARRYPEAPASNDVTSDLLERQG